VRSAVSDALHAAFADAERRAPGAHDGGSGRAAKGAATPSPGGAPSDKLWPKMDPTRYVQVEKVLPTAQHFASLTFPGPSFCVAPTYAESVWSAVGATSTF
jgi:hypothetical protein